MGAHVAQKIVRQTGNLREVTAPLRLVLPCREPGTRRGRDVGKAPSQGAEDPSRKASSNVGFQPVEGYGHGYRLPPCRCEPRLSTGVPFQPVQFRYNGSM